MGKPLNPMLALEEFRNLGIDFVNYQENIDTSSPLGGAIFTIICAVAQLERDIIAKRSRTGRRIALGIESLFDSALPATDNPN